MRKRVRTWPWRIWLPCGDSPANSLLDRIHDDVNHGLVAGGPPGRGSVASSVVVVGLYRGGTTMVARMLESLGVFLGDATAGVVREDPEWVALLRPRWPRWRRVAALADARSAFHPLWGLKFPGAVRHLPGLLAHLPEPRLVAVFRDPLAVAVRETLAMGTPAEVALGRSLAQLRQLHEAVRSAQIPWLAVSYEKGRSRPRELAAAICDLIGRPSDDATLERVAEEVETNPTSYLRGSRRHRAEGHLDGVSGGGVFGWARARDGRPARVEVEVTLDRGPLATVLADRHRQDLEELGVGDGRFGFWVVLPTSPHLVGRHVIAAGATTPLEELEGSPIGVEYDGVEWTVRGEGGRDG